MAAPAASAVFLDAVAMTPASDPMLARELSGGVKEDNHEEEMRRRRRQFEQLTASNGPGSRRMYEARNVHYRPCVLYTMKVSVEKARVSWSQRRSGRFFPERRGATFPILLCRAVDQDQVEQVVHRSGEPGRPDRPGILSGIRDPGYYSLELRRERDVIHMEGSSAPWTEVAVIRGLPGGCGITLTSHVPQLVVRLHDMLFQLHGPDATVDLSFSEHGFCLPTGWTEERLYAPDGFHFVDIAAPVEALVKKLYAMRQQEDQEMERRKSETEEERATRLQREEAMHKLQEEEMRKILERKEEKRRREREEASAKRCPSLVWDASLWDLSEVQPAAANCYSKFQLSMNSNKQVSCKCVGQEGLQDMLRWVEAGELVLPISKTALPQASASSKALETLGFVEGYFDLETWVVGRNLNRVMDWSGRTQSSVLAVSRSAAKVLSIRFLVHKLDVLLDDGLVMSGGFGTSVDVHCDDISASELLKKNWAYHILCRNIDGDGRISFSTLLVELKNKLQMQQRKAEKSGLYNLPEMDAEEETEDLVELWRRQTERVPRKPEQVLAEVELNDCILVTSLGF